MPRTPHSSLNAPQALAEAGAARPVGDRPAGRGQGGVGVARRQLPGEAGEPGAEGERLDPGPADDGGVDEAQQRPGVGLHRPADVDQQHDPAGPLGRGRRWRRRDRLAAGAQRLAHRAAQVGRPRSCAATARRRRLRRSAPARRRSAISRRASSSSAGVYRAKSLWPQHLGGAEADGEGRPVVASASSSAVGVVRVVVVGRRSATVTVSGRPRSGGHRAARPASQKAAKTSS